MSPAHDRRPADPVLLDRAVALRDEWLGRALTTEPVDRVAAEAAVANLYRLVGAPPPRFTWVPSPAAGPPPDDDAVLDFDGPPGVPTRLADHGQRLRDALRRRSARRIPRLARLWPPAYPLGSERRERGPDALALGVPLEAVLDVELYESPRRTLHAEIREPVRVEAAAARFVWFGGFDADRLIQFDVRRRLGLLNLTAAETAALDAWCAAARAGAWWWPRDGHCVLAERPVELHTEPVPGAAHGERWLHRADGPAVRYADGWTVHAWHGTRVPSWAVEDPTVERVDAEPNVEVRRCAIERIGWETYVDRAGLALVGAGPDPGNPGCELRLYEPRTWGPRFLLVINGSVERDGHRRRYGISVPAELDDPVAAAGWSYGLTGPQYARLERRT